MSLESTIFRAIRSKTAATYYAKCALIATPAPRHFVLCCFDFRGFRASVGKVTPGRGGYQSTNAPFTNEQIPESYESLADSNVR